MAALYDWTGRPVDMTALREEQAGPSVVGIRSVQDYHLLDPLTPQRLGRILREAETPGYSGAEAYLELAERMEERDLHYLGVLGSRKRQVAQIGVRIEPASDAAEDMRDADLAREFFEREAIEQELTDLLDAVGKGFSVSEIDWETSERQWMPRRLIHRLPQWFDWDADTGSHLQLRVSDGWEPLTPYRFVHLVLSAKSGLPIRGGLARAAAWSWVLRSYTLRDWVRFVESYGHPIRLGRFPPGADPEDKAVLYKAVRNVAVDAAAILPEGMNIEFVDDTTVRGRAEVFRELVGYLDSRVSIAVLGQTLTTEQGDRGSQSLGNVHNEVRQDIERSDAGQLAAALRRDVVIPIVTLNHGPRRAWPRVIIEREPVEDMELLSKVLERLVPLGLRVREDEVRGRLRLSQPSEDDEVLRPGGAGQGGDDPASTTAAAATTTAARDQLAAVVDAISDDDWQRLAAPTIEPVLAAAKRDPADFGEALAALYPAMPVDAIQERLARVLFVADAWGRLDRS